MATPAPEPFTFEVADSPVEGRGVFATSAAEPGASLWSDAYAVVADGEVTGSAARYLVDWDDGAYALVLGPVAFLNHGTPANVSIWFADDRLEVVAEAPIAPGDELFLDYGPDADPTRPD